MTRVFVFGTLKSGFPNHHRNRGRLLGGDFTTREPYPLYLVGDRRTPWLMDQPGLGHRVRGEVYAVDAAALADMDLLERVAEPDGYRRVTIDVVNANDEILAAEIYLKPPSQLAAGVDPAGPYAEYTPTMALQYRPREGRNA